MRVGRLRHYIQFVPPVVSADNIYGPVYSWPLTAGVPPVPTGFFTWADVSFLSGKELWQAQQANSEAQGVIRCRFREDIDGSWRVNFRGRVLEILAVMSGGDLTETKMLFREWVERDGN